MATYEFIGTIATVIIAAIAVGGLVVGSYIRLESRVSRIEGLLEGYFMRESKREEKT